MKEFYILKPLIVLCITNRELCRVDPMGNDKNSGSQIYVCTIQGVREFSSLGAKMRAAHYVQNMNKEL